MGRVLNKGIAITRKDLRIAKVNFKPLTKPCDEEVMHNISVDLLND